MTFKLIIFFVLCVLLNACGTPPRVGVDERVTISRAFEIERIGGGLIRYVQPGDTLHGIAFSANLNANDVAAWNGIDDTQALKIGQRIRLTKPVGFGKQKEEVASKSLDNIESIESLFLEPVEPAAVNNPIVAVPILVEPEGVEPTNSESVMAAEPLVIFDEMAWSWPIDGEVLRPFSQSSGQHGIDIAAQLGASVDAANSGEVVYVGNGLRGYGNLIIVKHSEVYLSAYAHNNEIFVREGDQVNARQRIASVGVNRFDEEVLHFQIRKNGQPVNPLLFLSKSG